MPRQKSSAPQSETIPAEKQSAQASTKKSGQRANELSPDVVAVLMKFRELFKISAHHFQRIEADLGVSGSQLWAMSELQHHPGLKISELAAALSIHLSTASNLLDKLEKAKLIRRERADADQRVVRVYLTEAGETIVDKAPKPVHGLIPEALSKLPHETLDRLYHDLETLLQIIGVRDHTAALTPLAEMTKLQPFSGN